MNDSDALTVGAAASCDDRLSGPHFRPSVRHDRKEAPPPGRPFLVARALAKTYRKGAVTIPVLRGVDASFARSHLTAIVGQSGSGKSTLLHLLATLDTPDSGQILLDGHRIDNLPAAGRDLVRNQYIGMIFQFYHLLPELTTLENVLLPVMISHTVVRYRLERRKHVQHARQLLELVQLGHRLHHRPSELSGGELQRAAIARALMPDPQILLADEPTGNLDRDSGLAILQLLRSLNQQRGLTIVMVTHDHTIADEADRVLQLAEGRMREL